MFKEYKSKPITRKALKIIEQHNVRYDGISTAKVTLEHRVLEFKCYEEPKVGDYICYLNAEDIYHCSAKVFEERNIVE